MKPNDIDIDFLARLGTRTCPFCGRDGLPVTLRDGEDGRYIGWSCTNCDLNGVLGIHPPTAPATRDSQA